MQMTKHFLQIHLPKLNPCYKAWEQPAGGTVLHMNANKTEYMCFKLERTISTLNSGPLKLVDKFMYLGSSVSSTESNINMHLAKGWTAIDYMEV